MAGKTALNKERYHLNGDPFQTLDAYSDSMNLYRYFIGSLLFTPSITKLLNIYYHDRKNKRINQGY